VFAVFIRL